jgi:flagellar basal-body rod protein FlgB
MRIGDTTMSTIEWALGAEAERQRVTANNIANMNTPGFRSSRVDFESSLASALDSNGRDTATFTTRAANTPQNINGNDVELESETQILGKSNLHYQALSQALSMKFGVMRSAIGR